MKERSAKGLIPVGGLIKRYREERGWPQKELAARAKLNIRTVQRAECGTAKLQQDALQRIAAQLGLNVADIVDVQIPRTRFHENVRLFVTQSADEVCKLFSDVTKVDYKLRADPNRQQAKKLAKAFEVMAALKDCHTDEVWLDPGEVKMPFPDQIRMRGELNELMTELATDGFRFFIGQYILREVGSETHQNHETYREVITPQRTCHGVVVASTEATRSINLPCYGYSEAELHALIRKHLDADAAISHWPVWLSEFRRQYETETGHKVFVWNDVSDEVPF